MLNRIRFESDPYLMTNIGRDETSVSDMSLGAKQSVINHYLSENNSQKRKTVVIASYFLSLAITR